MITYSLKDFKMIGRHLRLNPSKEILGRDGYIVAEPFQITGANGVEYLFEEGFESDGGTVTWWARLMFPSSGRALPAYLIHDLGCDLANDSGLYSLRKSADNAFYDDLRECGYAKWRAGSMSFAVRKYGKVLRIKGDLK